VVNMMPFQRREPGSVIVFEYVSGGGPRSSPAGIAVEGLSMASALFRAFSALDGISVTLLLKKDIPFPFNGGNGRILPVDDGEGEAQFISECRRHEYAVLVAPETDGILESIAVVVPDTGVKLLGSDPDAVELASNKALSMFALGRSGIPIPRWCVAREVRAMLAAAEEIGYPVVGKPLRGTSCEGSVLFRKGSDIDTYFDGKESRRPVLLLQSLVRGETMSLSLVISRSGKARLISVNTQDISVFPSKGIDGAGLPRFIYNGGVTGIEEARFSKGGKWGWSVMEALTQKVVSSIPGLRGFVGIDFVMTDKGPVILEVNPRLTTPLAVAGADASWNLGKILLDACVEDTLPNKLEVPSISFSNGDPFDGSH